jgi:spore coat polysaccharide biosynthesis predicted glycosyltransferase SpsG
VVLRPDAGPAVGLGHLQRSLGLGVALREKGCSCVVRAPETGDVRRRVESLGLQFEAATAPWTPSDELLALDRLGPAAVVVDSYEALEDDLSLLQREGRPLVVIDDLARAPLSCDVVVNGAVGATELPYGRLAPTARALLGIEYLLLHPELWDVTPRMPSEQVERVLLTCGGSEASIEPLQKLLRAIEGASSAFQLTIAAPEGAASSLAPRIRASRRQVSVSSPDTTVREAAAAVDLAVASAGGTTRELLRLGVPTLALVTAENQRTGAIGLSKLGAVQLFESIDEAEVGLAQAVDELVASYEERRRLAECGPRTIDGQGCRRVAGVVLELLE